MSPTIPPGSPSQGEIASAPPPKLAPQPLPPSTSRILPMGPCLSCDHLARQATIPSSSRPLVQAYPTPCPQEDTSAHSRPTMIPMKDFHRNSHHDLHLSALQSRDPVVPTLRVQTQHHSHHLPYQDSPKSPSYPYQFSTLSSESHANPLSPFHSQGNQMPAARVPPHFGTSVGPIEQQMHMESKTQLGAHPGHVPQERQDFVSQQQGQQVQHKANNTMTSPHLVSELNVSVPSSSNSSTPMKSDNETFNERSNPSSLAAVLDFGIKKTSCYKMSERRYKPVRYVQSNYAIYNNGSASDGPDEEVRPDLNKRWEWNGNR